MKIQLLGTAGGDFPRVENLEDNYGYLPRVRALGGKNLRCAAQAVIFPDILIDYYNGQQLETFDIARESIKHLFINHKHWDHFKPLEILAFAASLPHQLQVYGSHGVIEALKFADAYVFDRRTGRFTVRDVRANIGMHVLEPTQTYEIGKTTVAPVHGNHCLDKSENMIMEDLCLNYVFERSGKVIFYALDSSYPFPLTVGFLRRYRVDVAVLDATFGQWPIDVVKSGHHNFEMLLETIEEFRAAGIFHVGTTILPSHISLAMVKPYDDLKEEVSSMGMTLAYDGLTTEA
jgi:ribonuclease BN (tRNA processing enzyme)